MVAVEFKLAAAAEDDVDEIDEDDEGDGDGDGNGDCDGEGEGEGFFMLSTFCSTRVTGECNWPSFVVCSELSSFSFVRLAASIFRNWFFGLRFRVNARVSASLRPSP